MGHSHVWVAYWRKGMGSGKRVFLLRRFDRAVPRDLIANPSGKRAPNNNFAPRHAVGTTLFFGRCPTAQRVHRTGLHRNPWQQPVILPM